jgi:hypothetical protein
MTSLLPILSNTPWWVFLLFALLLWLGILSLRPRPVPLRRLLITPAVFIGWGSVALALAASRALLVLPAWIAAAALGGVLAFSTVRLAGLRLDRNRGLVELPPSALPLLRNLLIFAAKYVTAVAIATHPDARDRLALWDMAISGAAAGYFIGWLLRFRQGWRRAVLESTRLQEA